MIKNYIENANFEDTGFAYTLSLISGKHKMVILYCLMEFETVRFNELLKGFPHGLLPGELPHHHKTDFILLIFAFFHRLPP